MTNGEKFKEVFKDTIADVGYDGLTNITKVSIFHNHYVLYFLKGWWNAEYKEPTTKNDKVDCEHTDCNNCVNHKYCDYESTTKNDLALLEKTYDDFCKCEGGEGWLKIDGKEYGTDVGYAIEGVDIFMEVFKRRLAELPSVTPQEPRCKNCKWWKDSDGEYRRGCGAESQCPINRREVFEGNGYCYLFEPQESEE